MGSKRYAKKPLLFIDQPTSGKVEATMQHHYRSSKDKPQTEVSSERKVLRRRRRAPIYEESQAEEIKELTTPTEENHKKKFKDMTVNEKLTYLNSRPDYAPKVICEFKTDEQSYRGIMLSYDEEKVIIRSGRKNLEIPSTNITQIHIVGL